MTTFQRAIVAATGAAVAAIYVLRLDSVFGLMVDDAWYAVLGQALAHGEGFRLVSSAVTPIMPGVPPGYPALLAVVFKLAPRFPDNIVALKSVSVLAMLGTGWLAFCYYDRRGLPFTLALTAAAAVSLAPGFVMLATSTLMAECVFTVAQLAAVMAVDRAAADDRAPSAIGAGALVALTWLVRSSGTALVLASFAYLVIRRRWRTATLAAATAATLAVPWVIYSTMHEPSAEERRAHGGSVTLPYREAMSLRIAGMESSGHATPLEIAARIGPSLANIFGRDAGALVVPVAFRSALESGQETNALGGQLGLRSGSMGSARGTVVMSLLFALVAAVGYAAAVRERLTTAEVLAPVTILMLLVVPFFTYRFVLPLAPFFFFYLLRGLHAAGSRARDPWSVARVGALCIVGFSLLDHVQYIAAARDPARRASVVWLAEADAVNEVAQWMQQHVADRGAVATSNPGLFYMLTGRKTVTMDDYTERWDTWKRSGIQYIVCLYPWQLPPRAKPYTVLFRSARQYWIIEI
jgi:hypothetical protein